MRTSFSRIFFFFFFFFLLVSSWKDMGMRRMHHPTISLLLLPPCVRSHSPVKGKRRRDTEKRKGNNKTPQHSLEERKRKTFIYPSIEFYPFLFSLSRQKAILGTTVISANSDGDGASCNWLHVPSLLSYPIVPFKNWKKTLTLISRTVIFGPTPPFFQFLDVWGRLCRMNGDFGRQLSSLSPIPIPSHFGRR